jgi:hypothetical protein
MLIATIGCRNKRTNNVIDKSENHIRCRLGLAVAGIIFPRNGAAKRRCEDVRRSGRNPMSGATLAGTPPGMHKAAPDGTLRLLSGGVELVVTIVKACADDRKKLCAGVKSGGSGIGNA